ncbi:hypothetical protein [Actinoplanes auranticolor]|uniref:Glycosyl hydrolase family 13 catalytic domain-containing protein n=1 Tax=Actinoplanes auranticolor TaxID=47988 RepID=A0A919VHL8_9ACTN|nr:hypothetical protein [Actinoplanes auranticolor]GIM65865.1 hypothetical protein Aau02nite_20290 [Actinoplanes auranticolor]
MELVERDRALYGAWYEIFPRSEGATFDESTGRWTSGTFRTAARRLTAIAAMGFDVVYLTPIHPIGRINRKGANNTLRAATRSTRTWAPSTTSTLSSPRPAASAWRSPCSTGTTTSWPTT